MDRTLPSEGRNVGSTPAESTQYEKIGHMPIFSYCVQKGE